MCNPVRISTSFWSQAAAMQHPFCLYSIITNLNDSDSNTIVVDLFRVRMEMSIVGWETFNLKRVRTQTQNMPSNPQSTIYITGVVQNEYRIKAVVPNNKIK